MSPRSREASRLALETIATRTGWVAAALLLAAAVWLEMTAVHRLTTAVLRTQEAWRAR